MSKGLQPQQNSLAFSVRMLMTQIPGYHPYRPYHGLLYAQKFLYRSWLDYTSLSSSETDSFHCQPYTGKGTLCRSRESENEAV